MRSELRTALAVLASTAVLLGSATMALAADGGTVDPDPAGTTTASPSPSASTSTPTSTPTTPTPTTTAEPSPSPTGATPDPEPTTDVPTGAFTVTDAQVRWGVNDESNNRAFAPGTFNFFSAGKIPDPGRGGVVMPQSDWKQSDGNVTIEKYLNGAWTPATWAGRSQTSTGATMSGTNGPFSNHEVVISGGTGTVDVAQGRATIQWAGSFTVLYYSGYSFFYVSDPKLTVANGIGTLTATLSGYGSSMDDLEKWEPVAPVPNVTLADLGAVDLSKDLGFTATPAYSKVAVSLGSDQVPQVTTRSDWGSFPQSFIDYQVRSGSGAYWYSSGGSADAHKTAKPVTVSYAAGSPVAVKPPTTKGGRATRVENDAPDAPTDDAAAAPNLTTTLPSATVAAPATGDQLVSGSAMTQFRPASTVLGATMPGDDPADLSGVWILGGVLLAGALVITASPFVYAGRRAS